MKTNFDKYRKCYYATLVVCAVLLAFTLCWGIWPKRYPEVVLERGFWHAMVSVKLFEAGIIFVLSLLMWRYSKCPHCGKSVFPFWGSFKIQSRILKRKPVLCAHCGEEVETD